MEKAYIVVISIKDNKGIMHILNIPIINKELEKYNKMFIQKLFK